MSDVSLVMFTSDISLVVYRSDSSLVIYKRDISLVTFMSEASLVIMASNLSLVAFPSDWKPVACMKRGSLGFVGLHLRLCCCHRSQSNTRELLPIRPSLQDEHATPGTAPGRAAQPPCAVAQPGLDVKARELIYVSAHEISAV